MYSWPNWDQRKSLDYNQGPDNRDSTVIKIHYAFIIKHVILQSCFHSLIELDWKMHKQCSLSIISFININVNKKYVGLCMFLSHTCKCSNVHD